MRAKAEFHEKNVLKARRTSGHVLNNGDIVFTLEDREDRKMVLTSNAGQMIKDGKLPMAEDTWKDPDTWKTETKGLFKITNFTPRQGTPRVFMPEG